MFPVRGAPSETTRALADDLTEIELLFLLKTSYLIPFPRLKFDARISCDVLLVSLPKMLRKVDRPLPRLNFPVEVAFEGTLPRVISSSLSAKKS